MFNIRSLVNRISQVKDGEASETVSNKNRSVSQATDEEVPTEAEGFLCPTCMAAFPSADDLQTHYEKEHLEPGANYLCPVCKARLENASALELHYSANHSSSRSSGDAEALVHEINSLTSSLNEEKWNSEELRKELDSMREMLEAQGSGDEQKMYQMQLQGLSETKSLLTSEVVLLRKQLAEALETTLQLKQGRDKLEEKTARHSQTVARLQSSLDENNGLVASLYDQIKDLESQLSHKSDLDDAEVLKKELSSVQHLMDKMTRDKELELDQLRKTLADIQTENELLKNGQYSPGDRLEVLEDELKRQKEETEQLRKFFAEKTDQVMSLQHMREETDVCVVQLRQEVTSLQEMLNETRHRAEGQVSAKDDELTRFKIDLSKHRDHVEQLETKMNQIQGENEQLASQLEQKTRDVEDRDTILTNLNVKSVQLEEKVIRLEQEKEELMAVIQKGEGSDTAIHQLQQENGRLVDELATLKVNLSVLEDEYRTKGQDWSSIENRMKENKKELEEKLLQAVKDLENGGREREKLESSLDIARQEIDQHKTKSADLETMKNELEQVQLNQVKQLEEMRNALAESNGRAEELQDQVVRLNGKREELEQSMDIQRQMDAKRIQQLEERVAELEPLTEAIEHEKLRRIKEKAEWGEHEQLLRGEKESLATLTTHLQQQVEEQTAEHRIHIQRLRNESDSLARDKDQLAHQLDRMKDGREQDKAGWTAKCQQLEEQVKELKINLNASQDLSAAHFQRCQELQLSSDKYHSLKIELETRLALFEEEKTELANSCGQWQNEVDRLKFNAAELRRRLEDSQAALHELGRENQSLQMENAKLQGRKWADDSEAVDCHTCQKSFNITVRKHHCRNCGQIFCNECSAKSAAVGNSRKPVRVCDPCHKELTVNSPR